MVIEPADSRALVPGYARRSSQGVVVVNIDNELDDATLTQRRG